MQDLSVPTVEALMQWLQARATLHLPKVAHPSANRLVTPTDKPTHGWATLGKVFVGDNPERDQPLFTALDRACYGHRLTGTGLYKLVQGICHKAGIQKPMSPHRIRHSGITEALEITGGDVRAVQKLSRHAKLETLMVYDDARTNAQQKVTELLAAML